MPLVNRKSNVVYIGVDPGLSGGLCALVRYEIDAEPMPACERDLWTWFATRNPQGAPGPAVFAVIEKVNGYIGNAHPGSAMFKFGASFGALKMALCAAGIPYEEVPPQSWQRALGIPKRAKDESKSAWKKRLKAHAQRLFPQHADLITLKTADAVLIAEFCRRKREGELS